MTDENTPQPASLQAPTCVYLFTLDSHDYYGPFHNEAIAHDWAKRTGKSSYQLHDAVPVLAQVHNPRAAS